jgi:polysaccharide export outer membrane protein
MKRTWVHGVLGAFIVCALTYACTAGAPAQVDPQAESASPFQVDTSYHIQGGDQLAIGIDGDPTLTQNVTVLDDGTVSVPPVGPIDIGGMTLRQAQYQIAHRLSPYMIHPQIVVSVVKEGVLEVTVLGDVKTPGKYELRSQGRLLDAIAAAGGINDLESGVYPDAHIAVPGGDDATISLQNLFQRGDISLDVPLQQGSVVYVPGRMQFDVKVLGAVDRPGLVRVHQGDRVDMAIALAGDSRTANADLNRIALTRHFSSGAVGTYGVNLYPALERGDERYDPVLKPGDILFVPETNHSNAGSIASGFLYLLGSFLHW